MMSLCEQICLLHIGSFGQKILYDDTLPPRRGGNRARTLNGYYYHCTISPFSSTTDYATKLSTEQLSGSITYVNSLDPPSPPHLRGGGLLAD